MVMVTAFVCLAVGMGGLQIKHKERKKCTMEDKKQLLSFYTARISKSGKYVNVTLIDECIDGSKIYYNACVKLDNSGKVKANIKDGYAYIKIKLAEDKKDTF